MCQTSWIDLGMEGPECYRCDEIIKDFKKNGSHFLVSRQRFICDECFDSDDIGKCECSKCIKSKCTMCYCSWCVTCGKTHPFIEETCEYDSDLDCC